MESKKDHNKQLHKQLDKKYRTKLKGRCKNQKSKQQLSKSKSNRKLRNLLKIFKLNPKYLYNKRPQSSFRLQMLNKVLNKLIKPNKFNKQNLA